MSIKEATKKMLRNICIEHSYKSPDTRGYDKQIAKMLLITPASFSRLKTGVTTPKIMTWIKIIDLHKNLIGEEKTNEIIRQVNENI